MACLLGQNHLKSNMSWVRSVDRESDGRCRLLFVTGRGALVLVSACRELIATGLTKQRAATADINDSSAWCLQVLCCALVHL